MMQPGFYNMDCMDALKQFPDQFFDLAIVDPPYGDAQKIGGGYDFIQPIRRAVRQIQDGLSGSTTAAGRKDIQLCGGGGYDLIQPIRRKIR